MSIKNITDPDGATTAAGGGRCGGRCGGRVGRSGHGASFGKPDSDGVSDAAAALSQRLLLLRRLALELAARAVATI